MFKADAIKLAADQIERTHDLCAWNSASPPGDVNIPEFDFHKLRDKPHRYSTHINGPWCITFGWEGEDATDLDLEQYH